MELNIKNKIRSAYTKVSGIKDLSMETQKIATKTSALYIYKNMLMAKPLETDLEVLKYASSQASQNGLVLEFGVFSGRSINFLSSRFEKIYGFDSFEGLPEKWHTNIEKGHFALKKLPFVNDNVELIKGLFEDTLPKFKGLKDNNSFIAFLHVDCDLYSSTISIFKF